MKKAIGIGVLGLLLCGSGVLAQRREFRTWVFGTGQATAQDRFDAEQQANDTATDQANAICTGRVETVEKTSTICLPMGSDDNRSYSCSVSVKALCVIR